MSPQTTPTGAPPPDGRPSTEETWTRLAGLRPRLRPHTRIVEHRYRGEPWYVVEDLTSSRYHRFGADAYAVISRLDGERTLGEVHDALRDAPGGPSKEEILALLAQLSAAELLDTGHPTDPAALLGRVDEQHRRRRRERWLRPLTIKIPLVDPDRWLEKTLPAVRPLFQPLVLALWLGAVLGAGVLATLSWPELLAHWETRGLDPRSLLLLAAVYPGLKLLHELGHAYAVKIRGGEVHEMGIMLLVFVPLPYVDASAAIAFPDKRQRMLVGAIGIMVELLCAAAALAVWLNVEPGWAADAAFAVLLIGSGSTLLFNGNPLLRFDGYYVLADAIEIPNLASRANRYLGYWVQRHLLRLPDARSPVRARGERGWFWAYGLASFVYRTGLTAVIALYVAGKAFVIGVLLALWVLFVQFLLPLAGHLGFLARSPRLRGRRLRAAGMLAGSLGALAFALLVPLPSWTNAQGLIRLPEHAAVRTAAEGFVTEVLVPDGAAVVRGELLLRLENPALLAHARVLELEHEALATQRARELLRDRVQAEIARGEIARIDAALTETRARIAGLAVLAPADGAFHLASAVELTGRYLRQGEVVGHVLDAAAVSARVVIPQADAAQVRASTQRVELRLASRPGATLLVALEQEVPAASAELPGPALGSSAGGRIPVDARDRRGLRALGPVFQLDLALPAEAGPYPIGMRVHTRFQHPREPLAWRWYRRARRLLMDRFEV